MTRYIAFLRAINVGGHIVKMEKLRALFEEMGFQEVETFIASGQVIFATRAADAAKLESRIEKHLQGALGYEVSTFIRTPAQLRKIARVARRDGRTLYVCFTRKLPGKAAQDKLAAYNNHTNEFEVHGTEVYWYRRGTLADAGFTGAMLEKIVGMPVTARNINTIDRLVAKY